MRSRLALVVFLPLLASTLEARGPAFRVRAFQGLGATESSTGDREPGTSGAFWIARASYDNPTGYYYPEVMRLSADGTYAQYRLDAAPQSFFPFSVRRDPSTGTVYVIVPLTANRTSALYTLDPQTNAVTRTVLPFLGTGLALDPSGNVPWITGTGKIARLSGGTLSVYDIPNFEGTASRFDGSRRLWLQADNGRIVSFSAADGRLETYDDAAIAMRTPDVSPAPSGVVWSLAISQDTLFCFEPGPRRVSTWKSPLTSSNWAGLLVAGDTVSLASSYGPHFLSTRLADLPTPASTRTLAAPTSVVVTPTTSTPPRTALTATRSDDRASFTERIAYAEPDEGKSLFPLNGNGYSSLPWAGGGETLTGSGPLQWWRPLASGEAFTTEAALPVVVEVRPDDPTTNFFTEVALTNVDADPTITLALTTSTGRYTSDLTVVAGRTLVFPSIVKELRDRGVAIPAGTVAGTLVGKFRNGSGRLQARVYTKTPDGSTTGLGYTSQDPSTELFGFRKSVNGLKNTPGFRTNIAVANLCGVSPCVTLEISADFFDDATGARVGGASLSVPPNEWRQLDSPLSTFPGAVGETFSVLVTPFQVGVTAYDAYATVISNANQDAAFVRAASVTASSNLTLPVITDAGGIGTRFTSECAISNTGGGTAVADVTFTSSKSGNSVSEVLTLGNARGVRYSNAVDHFRQLAPDKVQADDFGPLRISFRDFASGFASSRTTASNGTGLGFVALDPTASRAFRRKKIIGLKETGAFRTNLAVVHPGATTFDSAAPITVQVTITDAAGNVVGTPLTKTLNPGQLHQWTRVLADPLGVSGEGYQATIERTAGNDAFDAYVTIIDNASSDPTFVRAE